MTLEFDTGWLIARRREARHSTYTLAEHIAATPASVRAIEGGTAPDNYPIGVLARYSDGLGCTIADLFTTPSTSAEPSDIAAAVATIVACGGELDVDALAGAQHWTPEHTRNLLRAAADPLAVVGLGLAWHGDGTVVLVTDPHTDPPVAPVQEATVARDGLTIQRARMLARFFARGERPKVGDQLSAGFLTAAGFLEPVESGDPTGSSTGGVRAALRLTDRARFDLCIDEQR